MRDAPPLPTEAQQLQNMLLQQQQQQSPMPFLRQHEPMNQSSLFAASQPFPPFHQTPPLQDLLARYQQQQQQLQNQQQQQYLDSSFAAAMGQPTLQDMMFMQQQQHQQQQQQHGRGTEAFADMGLGGGGGYGGGTMGGRPQFVHNQLWGMNDLQQQQSLQDQLQHQQHLLNTLSPQSQLQLEQQLRRRSSLSSTRSLSPLAPGGGMVRRPSTQGGGNPNFLFGNNDYTRLMASTNTAPLSQSNFSAAQHRSPYPGDDSLLLMESAAASLSPDLVLRKDKKKRAKSFPEKLMQAMMENENERAVAWLPDGKSFVIVSPDLFVNEVLSSSFKEAKYASFVRKLHRWGFIRLTSGTGTDCFHHPSFNRNYPEYAARITCAPMKEGQPPPKETKPRRGVSEKPPSLAGVERFIRAKAAAYMPPGDAKTPRRKEQPSSDTTVPVANPPSPPEKRVEGGNAPMQQQPSEAAGDHNVAESKGGSAFV